MLRIGERFAERVNKLVGYNEEIESPTIQEFVVIWEVVEIYDERNILARNKDGELKGFLIGD